MEREEGMPLGELVSCVDRELGFRRRVYPRWVNAAKPKMNPKQMELELSRMQGVRDRLVKSEALHLVAAALAAKAGVDDLTLLGMLRDAEAGVRVLFPEPPQ